MNLDNLLLSYRDYYGNYHNHKEQMGYGAAVLFLGLASAAIVQDRLPSQQSGPGAVEIVMGVLTAGVAFLFVWWQLRRREDAADMVKACTVLLARSVASQLGSPSLAPTQWRGISVPADLATELNTIAGDRRILADPRLSEVLTYFTMALWAVVAGLRVGGCI